MFLIIQVNMYLTKILSRGPNNKANYGVADFQLASLFHCSTGWWRIGHGIQTFGMLKVHRSYRLSSYQKYLFWRQQQHIYQALKFKIECTCPPGKWIVNITCLNVPFTCLKYIKPVQLLWKSEIISRPSDKSCRYSTCPNVIFTHLKRWDEWNF